MRFCSLDMTFGATIVCLGGTQNEFVDVLSTIQTTQSLAKPVTSQNLLK